jgi:hypothetical protein
MIIVAIFVLVTMLLITATAIVKRDELDNLSVITFEVFIVIPVGYIIFYMLENFS